MTDRTKLKKTLFLFNQQASRLLQSDWEESPLPYKRFLDSVEEEPAIQQYLSECVSNHTPVGFDAHKDVSETTQNIGLTLVNFSTVPEEESAEVYLILKEVIEQNIQGRSYFYYGYGNGSKHYADMYKGFLNKVVRRLIANIEGYLSILGIEMGLDDSPSAKVSIFGDVKNSQFVNATGNAPISITQKNGLNDNELSRILSLVMTTAKEGVDDDETLSDIRENVEMIQNQLASKEPKHGVLKGAIGFLKGVKGGAEFSAAVAELVSFLASMGL